MPKVRVPVLGTVGKSILIDPAATDALSTRLDAVERAIAAVSAASGGSGGSGTDVASILTTQGDMLTRGTHLQRLAIGATGYLQRVAGGMPSWASPSALSKVDDTNVTLTLGGNPNTALVDAASLTLGWTGQLAATRGGTGFGSYTAGDLLYANSTTTLLKLGIGSANDIFTVSGGAPAWAARSTLFANPTATIGLTAVNGTATTGLRSDAAPALSQAIQPTWTDVHRWSGTNPFIGFIETDQTTDEKRWGQYVAGKSFFLASLNDAESTVRSFFQAARGTGVAITDITYGNSTDYPISHFYSSSVKIYAPEPRFRLNETDAGTNEKIWQLYTSTATFGIEAIDDSISTGRALLTASRSGVGITAVSYGNATDIPPHTFHSADFLGLTVASPNAPWLRLQDTGAATNEQFSLFTADAGSMELRFANDAFSDSRSAWAARRTASSYAVASLTYGNALDLPSHTFYGGPFTIFSGQGVGGGFTLRKAGSSVDRMGLWIGNGTGGFLNEEIYFDLHNTDLHFYQSSAAIEVLRLTYQGQLIAPQIHNNAGGASGSTPYIASGTYTPTITTGGGANSATARASQWLRVGKLVTVSGGVNLGFNSGAAADIGISLPIASSFSDTWNCGGSLGSGSAAVGIVLADATNDRARGLAPSLGAGLSAGFYFHFTYLVI